MITGVQFKELITHTDQRGFFREVLRNNDNIMVDGFAQLSHSLMYNGVIKAWHWHRKQTDLWYVPIGVLRVGLYDRRKDSITYGESMDFLMGDNQPVQVLRIPRGVAHGCKTVHGPAHLIYATSQTHNTDDENRIAYDDPEIDFDWVSGPPIK